MEPNQHAASDQRFHRPDALPDLYSTQVDAYQSTLGMTKTNVLRGQVGPELHRESDSLSRSRDCQSAVPRPGLSAQPAEHAHGRPQLYAAAACKERATASTWPPSSLLGSTPKSRFSSTRTACRKWSAASSRPTGTWCRPAPMSRARTKSSRTIEGIVRTRPRPGRSSASTTSACVAQAELAYSQFKADAIAAESTARPRRGAAQHSRPAAYRRALISFRSRCRTPNSCRSIERRWSSLAEQLRPDVIELKIIIEAEQQRLIQAQDVDRPQLNAVAMYQWNGLSGTMPNGEFLDHRHRQISPTGRSASTSPCRSDCGKDGPWCGRKNS